MLSKILKGILSLFFLMAIVQCSFFFDEKAEVREAEVVLDDDMGGCLATANQTLGDYFNVKQPVEISSAQLNHASRCYRNTIDAVIQHTISGGTDNESYTASNLDNLIKMFQPDLAIGESRWEKYIMIKHFLIGGEKTTVSKEEMRAIAGLIEVVFSSLSELRNDRATLFSMVQFSRTDEGYQGYKDSHKKLQRQLLKIVKKLKPYDGRRFIKLRDVSIFFISEFNGGEGALKYLDLIDAFKNFALNENSEELNRQDLAVLVRQITKTYEALGQFEPFIKDGNIFTHIGHIPIFMALVPSQLKNSRVFQGVALRSLVDVINMLAGVGEVSIDRSKKQVIELDKVDKLFEGLDTAEHFTGRLTAKTLSLFLRDFASRWLEIGGSPRSAITHNKLDYVKKVFGEWVGRQNLVNSLFRSPTVENVSMLRFEKQISNNPQLDAWAAVLKRVATHQWDDRDRVLINGRQVRSFSYEELTVSNSLNLLMTIFMQPFNDPEKPITSYYVSEDQAQQVYESLRVLGVELAFMDSRIFDSGRRAFMEGNSFTTQKSNDNKMDYFEVYEYLSFAMSTGELADRFYESLDTDKMLDYEDVHYRLVTEIDYFRHFLKRNFSHFFNHLGSVNKYWKSLDTVEKDKFLASLEYAARGGVISQKPIDLTEIRVLVSVLQYVQSVFYTFDTNGDGIADGEELRLAEEHFRPLVIDFILKNRPETFQAYEDYVDYINYWRQFSSLWNPKAVLPTDKAQLLQQMAKQVFIFLLRYGYIPEAANIRSMNEEELHFAETKADVHDVLRVFAELSKITHESHVNRIRSFLIDQNHSTNRKGEQKFGRKLFDELDSDEVPNCRERSYLTFCRFAREIYCNETINPELYTWMRDNKYNLLHGDEWKNEPEVAAEKTMEVFDFTFRGHRKFSTQCIFPQFSRAKGFVGNQFDNVQETMSGTPEEKGLKDHWKNAKDAIMNPFYDWVYGEED